MRRSWRFWQYTFSLNSSDVTGLGPAQYGNSHQRTICSRARGNSSDIDILLTWLTEPDQLEQENYTTVMEDTLQKMVMTERDEKLCWNFYGKLLTDIQHWLNEVNVSHSITLDETSDFELIAQVRLE